MVSLNQEFRIKPDLRFLALGLACAKEFGDLIVESRLRTFAEENFEPRWFGENNISNEKISAIGRMKKQLQNLMTTKVGIFKTSMGLIEAELELKNIFLETQEIYQKNKLTLGICELRNMVSVAYLMIKQSQELKENIGVFYNHDNVA